MLLNKSDIRVRYADTDQMGYVYYGNYAQYYEVGRVEALRDIGMTYKEMEEKGVMLPVLSLQIKYIKPARYDDLLTIETKLEQLSGTRIKFEHKIYNEAKELLNTGMVELVFVSAHTKRPCAAPAEFIEKLNAHNNT